MNLNDLLNDPDIVKYATSARAHVRKRPVSDIIDDEGNQYVDLVMEGGGMHGIALVGYTYVLEQAGIRFLGIGGTSAGSINALLLAALEEPAKPKSPKMLMELCNKNFYDFIDGTADARDFVDALSARKGPVAITLKAVQIVDDLRDHLGLNRGDAFLGWMTEILAREGIQNCRDLRRRMETLPPGLRTRGGTPLNTPAKACSRLALVTADVTTETKVVFPEMAELYFEAPDEQNPAIFVRASMSIPCFFRPLIIDKIPTGASQRKHWKKHAGIDDPTWKIPKSVTMVDGGIMSNFPIALFHNTKKEPDAPTFGVKLGFDGRAQVANGPIKLLKAIFNSARHCLDYDFICRNPDFRQLVYCIAVDGYPWLDFAMPDQLKLGLFREGARASADFLAKFDWSAYKKTRKGLVAAAKAAPKKQAFFGTGTTAT